MASPAAGVRPYWRSSVFVVGQEGVAVGLVVEGEAHLVQRIALAGLVPSNGVVPGMAGGSGSWGSPAMVDVCAGCSVSPALPKINTSIMIRSMSKFDHSDLDGHLLQLLVAVVEEGSITGARSAWASRSRP
jgi:hypothetical protein